MNKTIVTALSVSVLLTGCGLIPTNTYSDESFNNAVMVNFEKYEKFREDTIKPHFEGEFESCYQGELIDSSDNYKVFLFKTNVLNTKFFTSNTKVTNTDKFELGLYRDHEAKNDILFEGENGYSFKVENTELSSYMTSVIRTSYLSGYDNSKAKEEAYKSDSVDTGIQFVIAESKPGKFTYSFKDSKLLGFNEVKVFNDAPILIPIQNKYSIIASTENSHSHNANNRRIENKFTEFGTKVESIFTDVYICKSDTNKSPVKTVER